MAKTFVHAHHKINRIDRKLERSARRARQQTIERADRFDIRTEPLSSIRQTGYTFS